MQLTNTLQLTGIDSLSALMAIPYPVRPSVDGHGAFIDVIVGLKTVEVHASAPLAGWRLLIDQDTRFEIAPDTTGAQLAAAFADPRVLLAIEQLISPPTIAWPRRKADVAQLTGTESFDRCIASLIDALGRHLMVLRKMPLPTTTQPMQTSLL